MKNKKILIVEDDVNISNLLCDLLKQNGCLPVQVFSGTEALMRLENAADSDFDLILLDLMLPGKTGLEVLTDIRGRIETPVIALTAVADKESVVNLLKAGANDYVTKPFDNAELLARIEVQLRSAKVRTQVLHFREITLDTERFDGFIGDAALGLSKREYEILKLLMENPTKVFTKNNLYESVWRDEFLGDDNTINVHISKIRGKIAKFTDKEYIRTVWGIGFKMEK
ncbi:MAG: response regulator transcription factor [Oscillospiraceae bacterium]|nr:response regulator transcription factor [Oscillospiraceae bacterium]